MFCGDDDEEYYYGVGNEPSEYEQMLESKRQQRLLDRQIEQYGDDAMRTDARLASDSGSIPTEEFQRSYQMRIPGVKHAKAADKDPLRSLLKAMGQSTGRKKNRVKGKENKSDGGTDTDNTDDTGQPRSGAAGEPTKDITLYSR